MDGQDGIIDYIAKQIHKDCKHKSDLMMKQQEMVDRMEQQLRNNEIMTKTMMTSNSTLKEGIIDRLKKLEVDLPEVKSNVDMIMAKLKR